MCRSDALIGLSSTRTSASPGAKGGVGISASCNTLFGSPVSRKINAFINTSWVFRRRLIPAHSSRLDKALEAKVQNPGSFDKTRTTRGIARTADFTRIVGNPEVIVHVTGKR